MTFGHAVRPMDALERATQERYPTACRAARDCPDRPTHLVSSQFTGPEGRINAASRRVCLAHAEAFAARHGLRIPRVLPEIHL